MKSILMVGNFLSNTLGTRSVCEDLADRLEQSGWNVIRTSTKRARLPKLFDMVSTVWRRRSQYRIAQVDVYSGAAFIWAETVCSILRKARKPYVLTLHGGNLVVFARKRPHRVKRLLSSAFAVTTPSNFLFTEMKPYCSGMILISNPIDLQQFSFRERVKAEPRLIWLRAFHRIYNPAMAVDVVHRLRSQFPSVRLLMVGPDKDGSLEETRSYAARLGVLDVIEFSGSIPRNKVPEFLNQCDVFLNTTNFDNAPVSILEAMACGLCIISTNVGGLSYMLEHERNALLVPPSEPEEMTQAVFRILNDHQLANKLSTSAGMDARRSDWSVVLPQWQSLLESAEIKGTQGAHIAAGELI